MATPEAPGTTRSCPAAAFRRMGWAFLFLAISVSVGFRLGNENFSIDVLPDFVGYLVLATAANRLVPFHRRARRVRNLALLLTYLSIATIVQYTVVTSQSGNVTTWKAPLWPLTIAVGLLELVLVWMLCGLVADLARRAGDEATEQRARSRRAIYILARILLTGSVVFALMSPDRELIIGLVIAGLVVGLILLGLMMGLMRRAARMCEERPEVATLPADTGLAAPLGRWVFRALAVGSVLLPIALAVGAAEYYEAWKQARIEAWRFGEDEKNYWAVRSAFYAHLLAGRIDEAHESTTADFRTRISRERLAELASGFVAYTRAPFKGGPSGSSGSGAVGGDPHIYGLQQQRVTESDYVTLLPYDHAPSEMGKVVRVTITIRRDRGDSILRRRPPPIKVDDFKVEEKPGSDQRQPGFGRPPSTGGP